MRVRVFQVDRCIKCDALKSYLRHKEIDFEPVDMNDLNNLAELFANGVYSMVAPVLQVENSYLLPGHLFQGVDLHKDLIDKAITGEWVDGKDDMRIR